MGFKTAENFGHSLQKVELRVCQLQYLCFNKVDCWNRPPQVQTDVWRQYHFQCKYFLASKENRRLFYGTPANTSTVYLVTNCVW